MTAWAVIVGALVLLSPLAVVFLLTVFVRRALLRGGWGH